MTSSILIAFCLLLLVAYIFDVTSSFTKIPSVILLLLLGWLVRQSLEWFEIILPEFTPLLPILGTMGLILIVLEGSLELELNREKFGIIGKSILGALVPMLGLAFLIAYSFKSYGNFGLKDSLTNAIPFCVISSAIAIPSVRNLSKQNREFVIYESSLSDIIGVVLFNFLALNSTINSDSFMEFGIQMATIIVVSFVATLGLSILLYKIDHHIKFIPIILLIVLIYALSKVYHLPGLIFILFFGLSIGNLEELKQFKWIEKFKPEVLKLEVEKFRELTGEIAFLVRALFFLLFGYLMESAEILNRDTFLWAVGIVFFIFILRAIQLKLSQMPLNPLLFVAPRGLITILLFLSIDPQNTLPIVNKSLIIQVILMTALIMMVGMMGPKPNKINSPQ